MPDDTLTFLHVFSSSGVGGAELICCEAMGGMSARFVHDVVFTDTDGRALELYRNVVRRVSLIGKLGPIQRVRELVRIASSHDYNAAIVYGGRANLLWRAARIFSRRCRRPVYAVGMRGMTLTDGGPRTECLDALMSGSVELIFANSHAGLDMLRKGYGPKPGVVAHNGVDCQRFHPATDRRQSRIRCGLPVDARLVIATGHLRPVKNYPLLLEAFAHVHKTRGDVKLVLAGDELDGGAAARLAKSLEIDAAVLFLGRRTDVPELLRAADVFVLSSDFEGMPNGLVQAMATGLPVVSTRVGGVPEIVTDRVSGLLVERRERHALARAMAECLDDHDLATRLGAAAVERIRESFSTASMCRQWEHALEHAATLRPR